MFNTISIPQFEGKEAASALHALICLAAVSFARKDPAAAEVVQKEILVILNNEAFKISEPLEFYLQSVASALCGNMLFTPDLVLSEQKAPDQ